MSYLNMAQAMRAGLLARPQRPHLVGVLPQDPLPIGLVYPAWRHGLPIVRHESACLLIPSTRSLPPELFYLGVSPGDVAICRSLANCPVDDVR